MPLGGVQEIGSNMTLIRTESEDIVIDCGLLFPYEECFDINYLIPDFSTLNSDRLAGIIITHGHEDHIGGLVQFLKKFPNTTIYANEFTLNLIKKKTLEHKISPIYQIFNTQSELRFKHIEILPVHVNHSIPETTGLIIRSLDKTWGSLYISDFKVDLLSKHEPPIDLRRIKEKLSECTYTSYFLDSTNIMHDGKTTTEGELNKGLNELINRSGERIFLTLFASNIHRLNTIIQSALKSDRKIVVMGRSLKTYLDTAIEMGLCDLSSDQLLLPDQVKNQTGKKLILLSGCQGDYLSALRRFSFGEDSNFKPGPGDLVVFSSKVIPGNEKKIYRIYNKLTEFGAEIVTANDQLIHASGHPGKEDLKILIDNFIPNYYFPIHGESYLLKKHFDFIQERFPKIQVFQILNYHEVIHTDSMIKIQKHETKEPVLIHGKNLLIEKTQISQRRKMATQGAVFVSFLRDKSALEISFQGLPLMMDTHQEPLKKFLLDQVARNLQSRETAYFKEQLRILTRQYLNNLLGYKPVTEVHLY